MRVGFCCPQEVFRRLMLYKPVTRECLWLYLVTVEGAVSLVLLRREGVVQQSIYFISHLLKDAEGYYNILKNLALALVLIARQLCPYFLSHPLTVLINSTLGHVLTNLEASG